VRLPKIEAAKLQIESAIWLWFVNGDIVSIYTLAAAAHRVLLELAGLWGARAWPCTAGYLCAPAEDETPAAGSQNGAKYFEYAKKNETYEVSEQWTELYLFDAVMAYGNLANDRSGSALMSTFVVRFGVEREDLFVADAFSLLERRISAAFNLARLKELSRIDFLKEFLACVEPAG
ncbi:MAG: hypothetical protein ACR2MW_11615, partial [Chthoniobacterales bacterium]